MHTITPAYAESAAWNMCIKLLHHLWLCRLKQYKHRSKV